MEGKRPQIVFYRPEILDLEEIIIPLGIHERLERLSEAHVECVIFAPVGVGGSCGRTILEHRERAIMFVVCHEPELRLNDKILFDLSELITRRPPDLEMKTAIERLMEDDCLMQPLIIPFRSQEHFDCETFINLREIKTKPQKPLKPLNKVFNSQSRQNIKHFMRKR